MTGDFVRSGAISDPSAIRRPGFPDCKGLSAARIARSAQKSLRRLQTDYLDLQSTYYLLPGNVITGDGEYPGTGVSYTLALPVTEFTLRQDSRLTRNTLNIWAVVPAGADGRHIRVASISPSGHRSTGIMPIRSEHDVEQTLLGISRTHPIPVSAICIQPPDSGVGMRPNAAF